MMDSTLHHLHFRTAQSGSLFPSVQQGSGVMEKSPGRKYQVIEEAEIDLVLQCKDSREFYERYLTVFPDTKKGLDNIFKIWKRRSEFAKKRPQSIPAVESGTKSTNEIAAFIADQTKI